MQQHIQVPGFSCIKTMTHIVQNNEPILNTISSDTSHIVWIFDLYKNTYDGNNDELVSYLIRYLHKLVWIGNEMNDGRIFLQHLKVVTKLLHENRNMVPLSSVNGALDCDQIINGELDPHKVLHHLAWIELLFFTCKGDNTNAEISAQSLLCFEDTMAVLLWAVHYLNQGGIPKESFALLMKVRITVVLLVLCCCSLLSQLLSAAAPLCSLLSQLLSALLLLLSALSSHT